jgi:uncharacterized BrkB/YihY/UPF0761 family membrane protein
MTTVVIRLAQQPPIRRAAHHAWTACLSAALTLCALTAGLTTTLAIVFLINPITGGPVWELTLGATATAATWQLAHYAVNLIRQIRART